MTARLAIDDDVAACTAEVLARLSSAGVDVEVIPESAGVGGPDGGNPLLSLGHEHLDLAVVGLDALRGSATDGLTMLAVLPREDPRDVLVRVGGEAAPLRALPRQARVAVTGRRRAALLRAHRHDLQPVAVADVTDLPALAAEGVTAAVMWSGDARRAGLSERATEMLDARSWPPEPGRGAVAILGRHPIAEVTALDHLPTRTALRAELALLDALDAPENAALGSLAQPSGRIMRLWAAVASEDGRRVVRADRTGPLDEPEQLGTAVARMLEARGAGLGFTGSGG